MTLSEALTSFSSAVTEQDADDNYDTLRLSAEAAAKLLDVLWDKGPDLFDGNEEAIKAYFRIRDWLEVIAQ